jgi:hypothetical protein
MHLVARVRWFVARRPWGQQTTVWVAETEIDPGRPIAAHQREVPRALAPAEAVTSSPAAAVARQYISAGAIITAVDVSVAGQAALIPDGWVALAVPVAAEHFAVGGHVVVYAADQFVAAGIVTERGEADVMAAVPAAAAPAVAAALLAGSITVGLTVGP